MSIKELMEQINELRATASVDYETVNPRVRTGVEGQVRSAQQKLPQIEAEYKKEVIQSAVPILVSGSKSKQFADISEKNFKTVTVDFNSANNRIVEGVLSKTQRTEFSNQEYFLMLNEINELARIVSAKSISTPDLNQDLVGRPIKSAINSILNSYYGSELRSVYAAHLVSESALKAQFGGARLPAVIYNSNGQLTAPFLTPVATLEIEEVPSDDEMTEIFSKIKNKAKNKKNKEQ